MAAYYDKQIIDTVAAAARPMRHRDIATQIAPGNNAAWNQIGTSLTHLYRAGHLRRDKTDGRYWHYWIGDPLMSEHANLAAADLDHAQQLLARAERAEGEVTYLREELATLEQAAHMPADYKFGLPTWINMELYACYIGLDFSEHVQKYFNRTLAQSEAYAAERDALAANNEALRSALGLAIDEIGTDMRYVLIDTERKILGTFAASHPGAALLPILAAARAWRAAALTPGADLVAASQALLDAVAGEGSAIS